MENIITPVLISDLPGRKSTTADAVIDAESTYSVMPRSLLAGLGVEPEDIRQFKHGYDGVVERPIGYVRIKLEGRATVSPMVFGEEGAKPSIGLTTLEQAGLQVHPTGHKLIPQPALIRPSQSLLPNFDLTASYRAEANIRRLAPKLLPPPFNDLEPKVFDRITVNPRILVGQPCIRGLRFPVYQVLELISSGMTTGQILEEFPFLEAEDIPQALYYAACILQGNWVETG